MNGNMLSCQLSIIVSAVIKHLQSNEMYSFRVCADNPRGEKGQYSGEVSACTKHSQGTRMAMAIISGIALAYHADNERDWLATSL